ncbi:unnamed protein product, partial [Lota lota]
ATCPGVRWGRPLRDALSPCDRQPRGIETNNLLDVPEMKSKNEQNGAWGWRAVYGYSRRHSAPSYLSAWAWWLGTSITGNICLSHATAGCDAIRAQRGPWVQGSP